MQRSSLDHAILHLIDCEEEELSTFTRMCHRREVKRGEILSRPGLIPNEVFFLESGLVRVIILDDKGTEHTIHFALENQFIADYSAFMLKNQSLYTLEVLADGVVYVMPREAIDWGYSNLKEGEKLGRKIAEYYFVYQDQRVRNTYSLSPKERYDQISQIFPKIHERVPQHMIASYLGITPVHLSRLKKESLKS
ncbi:MAG: Crp/Fnr family transcriptional regulator [Flavobacteriia bacterium]|nr:Crp/Fnr family transcriptional regulator [Flavobacteriia bacterium]